jgi:hypothetical protein
MKQAALLVLTFFCVLIAPSFAGDAPFDPKPWLEDLAQAREVLSTKYANLEWAVFDREAGLTALFADTEKRVEAAQNETDARAAFDRLARKLGDGHVVFRWPASGTAHTEPSAPLPCSDYSPSMVSTPIVARVAGYQALDARRSDLFPIGLLRVGRRVIGVIRIGLFTPQGYPELCKAAVAALNIPPGKPCDDACGQRIDDYTGREFNDAFIAQLEVLNAAKPDILLVDITRNGGGSEWAEAAARMLTATRLKSERLMFVRGDHWVKRFTDLESDLRSAAKTAAAKDRAQLLAWAGAAAGKKRIAATPCDSTPLWEDKHPQCSWLGDGFSTTGLLSSADPETLRGKPWAAEIFTPMEFSYREGIWRGPLIVAIDNGTGSAAEEFAATLQDNHAALLVGEPTVGAGCGHTDGGTPTVLTNSRAVLQVPDCARIRADGTNEVRGIRPDVLVGWRSTDGPGRRADDFARALPGIVEASVAQENRAP